jgi:enoyl-CoA hydratase
LARATVQVSEAVKMSAEQPVLVTRDGACATVTLNRPQQLNALSSALRRQFIAAFEALDRDEGVRAVVVTGAGRAFSAGLDLKELTASGVDLSANVDAENIVAALERFSKPVIAAVNGPAVTGGFELLLACDIVLASEAALFVDTHVKLGVTPGWGLSQRLSRRIGIHRAKELSLTARALSPREAEAWGLVNHVVAADQLLARAQEMARDIAQWEPAAVRGMKAIIDQGYALPFGEALRMEAETASRRNSAVKVTTAVLDTRKP